MPQTPLLLVLVLVVLVLLLARRLAVAR